MNEHPSLGKRWVIVALLVYTGAAIAMTWPLAARLTSHLPGHTTDTLLHYWNGWWVQQALSAGESPFHTPYLFYPHGLNLAYQNFAWLNVSAWLVLNPLVGGLAAYNLPFLANLVLCGVAAFLLTHELIGDRRAALLAGLIYQCWPFRLGQLDHPNLISTQWIPLFLLFLHRAIRRGRWQDGLLAGVFFALVGYTRWQQLIPATIVGGVYLAWAVLDHRRILWRRGALALLLAGIIAVVALAPPILFLMRQQHATPTDLLVEGDETTMQTDLLAYLTPGSSHPVWGSLTRSAYDRFYADRSQGRRFPAYVGVVALALALLGAYKARRAALPWLTMAFTLFLLALGPVLRVNGQFYPAIPMPYRRLTTWLPVLRWLREPDRFNVFLALPVAVLAGYGGRTVLAFVRQRGGWANVVVPCLLGSVILFEYLIVPAPLQLLPSSLFYAQLAAEPGEFAVLNLPLNSQQSKRYMAAQTIHHRPILQGNISRLSDVAYVYLDDHPWLRGLRRSNEMLPEFRDVSVQLATLAEDGVRYIILHKTLVDDDRMVRWQRYLLADSQFEDEQIVVYTTMPNLTLAAELFPGIGVIRAIASTRCLNPGRVLAVDVGWGAAVAPDFDVELALVSSDDATVQAETFTNWSSNGMAWGYYELRVNPLLSVGDYTIRLALLDPSTGILQGQPAIVGQVQVSHVCTFDTPTGAVGTNTLFGDDVRLLGYQLRHDENQLTLTLHWRAERRMETNYIIFIHIFDQATGIPVAQDDAMPHRNTFPTTFWWPGQIVVDAIPIPLDGTAVGVYGVAVGIYDPATMERLPVVDGDGHLLPDGRFVLPGETVHVEARE